MTTTFLAMLSNFVARYDRHRALFPLLRGTLGACRGYRDTLRLGRLLRSAYGTILSSLTSRGGPQGSTLMSRIRRCVYLGFGRASLHLRAVTSRFFIGPRRLSTMFDRRSKIALASCVGIYHVGGTERFLLRSDPSVRGMTSLYKFSSSKCFDGYFQGCCKVSPGGFMSLARGGDCPNSVNV